MAGKAKTDFSLSFRQGILWGTLLGLLLMALAVIPYFFLWGIPSLAETPLRLLGRVTLSPGEMFWGVVSLFLFGLSLLAGIYVHELLHVSAFVICGRADWATGIHWIKRSGLKIFVQCPDELPVSEFRFSLLLPGLVLGVLPIGLGWAVESITLTVWGAILLLGAAGDLIVFWMIRSLPGSALVGEQPGRMGCRLVD